MKIPHGKVEIFMVKKTTGVKVDFFTIVVHFFNAAEAGP